MNLFRDLIQSKERSYVYMATIYHLKGRAKQEYDKFIKIGYTSSSPERRFKYLPSCFHVKQYSVWQFKTESEAKRTEKRLHEIFRPYKYLSKHYTKRGHRWGGYQETFKTLAIFEYPIILQIGTENLFQDQELINYKPSNQI